MTETPTIFRTSALRTNVVQVLKNALLTGRFQPGQDINDLALAKEFGISRGPVREALLSLVQEGLVEHHQNRGFRIMAFTIADLRKMAQARFPLEVMALELAREVMTPQDFEHLYTLKDQLVTVFRSSGIGDSARVELDFHSAIWRLTGNPWIVAALQRVTVPYFVYISAFRMNRNDLTPELVDEQHTEYLRFLDGASDLSAFETVKRHLAIGEPTPAVAATNDSSLAV